MGVTIKLELYPDSARPDAASEWVDGMAVYEAGDMISGRVIVDVPSANSNIRGIRVKFSGKSDVRWEERTSEEGKLHEDSESYFAKKLTLFGTETIDDDNAKRKMEAGQYIYTFKHALPKHVPSTFRGKYGEIEYFCEAYVDMPLATDPFDRVTFKVKNSVNDALNISSYMGPYKEEKEKVFGCSCFDSSPLIASMKIPRTGWLPGETVNVQLDIDNRNSSGIARCSASVHQVVTYYATGTTLTNTEEISIVSATSKQNLPGGRAQGVHYATLTLPRDLPSSNFLSLCKLMDAIYVLRAIVKPKNAYYDKGIIFEVPIIIGTSTTEDL